MTVMVVIPTYNERQNIAALIPELFSLEVPGRLEILVVDDNSPDGTGDYVAEMAARDDRVHLLRRPAKLGLGTAYIAGFQEALRRPGVDFVVQMDADFSHQPSVIPNMLAMMDRHDLVLGSRYLTGVSVVNWPIRRLILSYTANWYARLVTGLRLTDITTGFKCFRREVLEQIGLERVHSVGYAFQIEMTYRAQRLGCRIGEAPIIFVDRHAGTSKLSRDTVREALWGVWKLRLGLFEK